MSKKDDKKMNGLNFISIGGCSEIGMNLYAYIYNDQWILVDMGMGFESSLGRELVVPSPKALIKNKSKIKALFITHSHEDHIGAIPYIWPMIECPIYARPFAYEMIREKLLEFDLASKVPIVKVQLGKQLEIGSFKVEFIAVAHSTPESNALAIQTPSGTIIHSGDWRIDMNPPIGTKTDEETLKKYGDAGVLALMSDSTNAFKQKSYSSEQSVRENLINVVKDHPKNRVIVTCFASNIARLESCYLAAKASGRQFVIAGKSLKKIERIAKSAGYFSDLPAFLDESKAKNMDPSKVLIVCTGSQGEVNSALSKIALNTHRNIQLSSGDVVIFSSRIIPGNEKSVITIQSALVEKGLKIINDIDYNIHASGHPSKEEIELLYSLVRPKNVIPIHGEIMHLYRQAEIARAAGVPSVIVPKDGDIIAFSEDGSANLVGTIDVGTLCVDGYKLIPIDGDVYKQRAYLATCGMVSICLKMTKGKFKIHDFYSSGIFDPSEKDEVEDIKNDIISEIQLYVTKDDVGSMKQQIEKIIRRVFSNDRGKKPMTIVHIVE